MMTLKSPSFQNGQAIPRRFSGEGDDVSPMLQWSGAPEATKSYALICEDPDAPIKAGKDHPYIHWMAYNIDANITVLPEGLEQAASLQLPVFLEQGQNSFGKPGYGGPMPPEGNGVHHYHFIVFALKSETGIPAGLTKTKLMKYIEPHIIASATLIGTYERKSKELFSHALNQKDSRASNAPFSNA